MHRSERDLAPGEPWQLRARNDPAQRARPRAAGLLDPVRLGEADHRSSGSWLRAGVGVRERDPQRLAAAQGRQRRPAAAARGEACAWSGADHDALRAERRHRATQAGGRGFAHEAGVRVRRRDLADRPSERPADVELAAAGSVEPEVGQLEAGRPVAVGLADRVEYRGGDTLTDGGAHDDLVVGHAGRVDVGHENTLRRDVRVVADPSPALGLEAAK